MRGGGREERRGENCRRADNPEKEHGALGARRILLAVPRHFEGGFCPGDPCVASCWDPRGIHRTKNVRWKTVPHPGEAHGAHKSRFARLRRVRSDGGLVSAFAATATCKAFAKCRRADNFGVRRLAVAFAIATPHPNRSLGRSRIPRKSRSKLPHSKNSLVGPRLSARRQFQKMEVCA